MSTDPELEVLKLRYEDVVRECDRLRSARASVTTRLGPLPASAAIVIGLVGTVGNDVGEGYLIAAVALFGLIVLLSMLFSSLAPYRLIRGRRIAANRVRDKCENDDELPFVGNTVGEARDPAIWLYEMLELEDEIYGRLRTSQPRLLPRKWKDLDLQDAFDIERYALNVVQLMFAAIIIVLVVGILGS
jgi:hypothetical protein